MMGQIFDLMKSKLQRTKKNIWVFTSFEGQYSDNPKYISMKLHELAPSIEIFWLVKKEKLSSLPEYVKGVEIHTPEARKIKASADVIIDNVYGGKSYIVSGGSAVSRLKAHIYKFLVDKKGQRVYTTWHGTPLKRMGRDQVGNDVSDFFCPNTTMILGNRFTLDIMKHLTFEKIPMKLLGTPRNDILFSSNEKVRELKEKLGLPHDKKILLYAPTFRNDGKDTEGKNVMRSGINQINEIDFNKLAEALSRKFGGEWVFVCRFHYHVEQMVDWGTLNEKYGGKLINGNKHEDMAEYLVCTDILLTDASSCMFDYAITKKPCMIYFPDIENYGSKERGFYIGVEELPFPASQTGEELISAVNSFDREKYSADIEKMFCDFGYVDDENSSERVVKYILGERK